MLKNYHAHSLFQDGLLKTKPVKIWRLILGLSVAVSLTGYTAAAKSGGTDVLHFTSKSVMVNTGVEPQATGNISVMLTDQGNAEKEQLKISGKKLNANTAYRLLAFIGNSTNATDIADFNTDKKGSFSLSYMKMTHAQPSKQGSSFPDALEPLCNVRELDVVNANTNAVLTAILGSPDKGQYLVKSFMKKVGYVPAAEGSLSIKASAKATTFKLTATHLTANTSYGLAFNGNLAQTYSSDNSGKLTITTLPDNAPDILDIQTVALIDSASTNLVLITVGLGIPCTLAHQVVVTLGAAGGGFAVLAGSTVANTALTTINGDLGLSPGSAVTGFPPGVVNGTQHVSDATASQAQLDLTIAYNDAAGRSVGAIAVAGNLGGMTLPPGLYKSTSSLEISSGDLTLDAQGDANAVFIFQIASTLTTTSGRQVILAGGAKAANIYWQVGTSAVLGTTSVFKGTIMADQSITLTTGANLEGRALARVAAVTLDSNTITVPTP